MTKKNTGFEIGSDSIKLAACVDGEVKAMGVRRLPEGLMESGRVTAPSTMVQIIKDLCSEAGIRGGTCSLVLPRDLVIARKIAMPVVGESELLLNLPFEFRDFVGKDMNKYDYDYCVVSVRGNMMELFAAAVEKEAVEAYYSIFRKAGLKLKAAMPAEMAWLNLIRSSPSEPAKVCVIDVGHTRTRVDIFSDGGFEMGRDIDIGGQSFDRAIADAQGIDLRTARAHKEENLDNVLSSDYCTDLFSELSVEVMKIVNFYRASTVDGFHLQDLYFSGGSSDIGSLRNAILKRTDMNIHHIRRFTKAKGIPDDVVMYCALAAGAGLQDH